MKLSGIAGTGSGKLGSQVYASVAGEQVVRNYQPKVSNPNTSLQVNQRARFKLLSQLSQVFGPILAFQKKGMLSARNQFVKKNIGISSGNDGEAMVTLENLQITGGSAGLPGILVTRTAGTVITTKLMSDATASVDRVCYVVFKKTDNQKLQLVSSKVVSTPGADGKFATAQTIIGGDLVVYAYGMKDLNSRAAAKYGNYTVESGEDIATLFMNRSLSYSDYRFTRTRGSQILAGETESQSAGPNQSRVFLTASGNGTVSGSGTYDNGDEVTITATPAQGCEFVGWKQNGSNQFVAYSPTLKFTASQLVDYIAVFNDPNSPTGGLDGQQMANPLPYSYAEVHIDGQTALINTGVVEIEGTFDSIGISNVGEGVHMTYVPAGSTLYAPDNIALEAGGTQNDDYGFDVSNCGPGTIYFENDVFFYITNNGWVNPFPNATLEINGSIYPIRENVSLNEGVGIGEVVTVISNMPENVERINFYEGLDTRDGEKQGTTFTWSNPDINAPVHVAVDGEDWFNILPYSAQASPAGGNGGDDDGGGDAD